jgi:hypothetical protein
VRHLRAGRLHVRLPVEHQRVHLLVRLAVRLLRREECLHRPRGLHREPRHYQVRPRPRPVVRAAAPRVRR